MDTAQWPQQGIGIVKSSVDNNNNNNQRQSQIQIERSRARPHKEQALNCPRCNSTNTKFCYYNNYSLSQPRYFCKTCRRYWTEGGSLRNVPVGGGSRKNKRSNSSSSNSNSNSNSNLISSTTIPSSEQMNIHVQNQSLGGSMSALELLRSGISARGLEPFVPGGTLFGAGFGFQEMMRPNSNNNNDINNSMKIHSFGNMQEEGDGRVLFPFEDLKQNSVSNGANEGQGDPTLFWNGVNGGGSW